MLSNPMQPSHNPHRGHSRPIPANHPTLSSHTRAIIPLLKRTHPRPPTSKASRNIPTRLSSANRTGSTTITRDVCVEGEAKCAHFASPSTQTSLPFQLKTLDTANSMGHNECYEPGTHQQKKCVLRAYIPIRMPHGHPC